MLLALQLASIWNLHANPRYQREDIRGAAQYVSASASGDDLILVFGGVEKPWEHYYRGNVPWRKGHPEGVGGWSEKTFRALLAETPVIWAVQGRMWEEPGLEKVIAVMEKAARQKDQREFSQLVVTRYQLRK